MSTTFLKKVLGKDDKFLELLEISANEARNSVKALTKALQHPEQLQELDEFEAARRKEKAMYQKISEELCQTFVTALEREDIESLSFALYRIPKTVEKTAERIRLAPQHLKGVDLSTEIKLLEQAVDTVVAMIQELHRGIHLERIKAQNDELQTIEGEADKALVEMLRRLYASPADTVQAVYLKDIFELLEKVADRCRDAGNVIKHIVLKNS